MISSKMKLLFFIFVFVSLSCVRQAHTPTTGYGEFESTMDRVSVLVKEERYSGAESYIRRMLALKWRRDQRDELLFHLGLSLHRQGLFEKAANVLVRITEPPVAEKAKLLLAGVYFDSKSYDRVIDVALGIYLKLSGQEKVEASRLILLSYIYKGDLNSAGRWYSRLNSRKRDRVRTELDEYFIKNPKAASYFNEVDPEGVESEDDEKVVEQLAVFNRVPAWDQVAVFLLDDHRYSKVNDLVKNFFDWYLKEKGLEVSYFVYSSENDVEEGFRKASDKGCFAVVGPLFFEQFSETFNRLSELYEMPVIAFSPYTGKPGPLFFNTKMTRVDEVARVAEYSVKEGAKRFALIYPDSYEGRLLRDRSWTVIERNGGVVTEAVPLNPGEKALIVPMKSLFGEQDDYERVFKKYKGDLEEKGVKGLALKRALERFAKSAPAKIDFDTMVILDNPDRAASIVSVLLLNNVEFNYRSPYLRSKVRQREGELRELGADWKIPTVLFAPPASVRADSDFLNSAGAFIDGAVLSTGRSDLTSGNKALDEQKKLFKVKFKRDPIPMEIYLMDMAQLLFQGKEGSGMGSVGDFKSYFEKGEFESLVSGGAVRFRDHMLTGNEELLIGVRGKGFVPQSELEQEKKEGKGD